MTHIPVQLPFKGFTEQAQFSAVPEGMTPQCLNVMPSDVWNGRMRISTRNGTRLYNDSGVQFVSTYRVYENGQLVEKLIYVRNGIIYYSDPYASVPLTTNTAFGNQASAQLNTTGLVEGVQYQNYFFFVDGDHYVLVRLNTPTAGNAVEQWGSPTTTVRGPYHTDPSSVGVGERATLICRWGARIVLAGYKRTPNLWYACAPDLVWLNTGGSANDGWELTDVIGAITGTSTNEYGSLGDPIVAIFPFGETGLMFACTNSFSFLNADPVFATGDIRMISLTKSIGIAGRRAWCYSQEKSVFILARDGLYMVNSNDYNFSRANRVSAGRLDSFFLRLDFGSPAIGGSGPYTGGTLKYVVGANGTGSGAPVKLIDSSGGLSEEPTYSQIDFGSNVAAAIPTTSAGEIFPVLCYDPDREAIWIFLSASGVEQSSIHMFYDLKTDSFWPQRFSDPKMYAPTSAIYAGDSRTKFGRLFLGGELSISMIEKSFPIGVDGYQTEMSDADQIAQLIRSSITLGPVIATIPYRVMINEIRIDLADNAYEVPTGFVDRSTAPTVTISTGDTAQSALGLQSDSLFVTNLNILVVDGGTATISVASPLYDGGDKTTPAPNYIDGRLAMRPFGLFSQTDPFSSGINRVYDGPGDWVIRWDPSVGVERWTLALYQNPGFTTEYSQLIPDRASPDGPMSTALQNPVAPDIADTAEVSGASFPTAEVVEVGSLVAGRNDAKRCRIRAEAAYATIASDGRPWSLERMSMIVSQVGKSRGD